MPELPEVETVRKSLAETVVGKKIVKVDVSWHNIVKYPEVEEFCLLIAGQLIQGMGRRGKFLIFYLDDFALVSHLRMEGKYGVFSANDPVDKHDHVIFYLNDGMQLRYKDVRKFGTMHLFPLGQELVSPPLTNIGPEPFSEEYTVSHLRDALAKSKRMVKPALLDQKIVAGLGNIYVDETLFRAGVHPEKRCDLLTENEAQKIYDASKVTLSEAIAAGGSTIRSYVNSLGQIGLFQLQLLVYGRAGQTCVNCGTELTKMKVGGRGTVVCKECQRLE